LEIQNLRIKHSACCWEELYAAQVGIALYTNFHLCKKDAKHGSRSLPIVTNPQTIIYIKDRPSEI